MNYHSLEDEALKAERAGRPAEAATYWHRAALATSSPDLRRRAIVAARENLRADQKRPNRAEERRA